MGTPPTGNNIEYARLLNVSKDMYSNNKTTNVYLYHPLTVKLGMMDPIALLTLNTGNSKSPQGGPSDASG